jgi:hypothetical protein
MHGVSQGWAPTVGRFAVSEDEVKTTKKFCQSKVWGREGGTERAKSKPRGWVRHEIA